MPLYEFECESCHRRFERIQKFSDPPPETCPHCGKGPVKKLLSSPAFQFKGSGFYITDYGKKGESSASESKEPASTTSKDSDTKKTNGASSETTKSETKSDASKTDKGDKKE